MTRARHDTPQPSGQPHNAHAQPELGGGWPIGPSRMDCFHIRDLSLSRNVITARQRPMRVAPTYLVLSLFIAHIILLVHELGHLIAARRYRVKVLRISAGWGRKCLESLVRGAPVGRFHVSQWEGPCKWKIALIRKPCRSLFPQSL